MKFAAVFVALALAASGFANADASREVFSEDREAQPIQPPRPVYPSLAARAKMPGACDVLFNVDKYGYPFHLRAYCTHKVFCQSAMEAVSAVRFEPKMVGGLPAQRENVVYPLEYNYGHTEEEMELRRQMIPKRDPIYCESDLVF